MRWLVLAALVGLWLAFIMAIDAEDERRWRERFGEDTEMF